MLIAEDLLLLLTDDRTGKLVAPRGNVDIALGGAVLLELFLARRVDVSGDRGKVRAARLVVTDPTPTSDPVLDGALGRLAQKPGKKPKDVVQKIGKGLSKELHVRLAERGLLRAGKAKVLGIFPTDRWPAEDPTHEDSVRVALTHALRVGATDDPRVGAVVSLLHALNVVDKVVAPATVGLTRKEVKANAKLIAAGSWASEAVRKAIDEAVAAVLAATAAAAAATSGG